MRSLYTSIKHRLFPLGLLGIIFDVDGVLFNSRTSNITYYNRILETMALPFMTKDQEEYCLMASVQEALLKIVPPERIKEAYTIARSINYEDEILPMLIPETGLLEALHWLNNWNIRLGICTNRNNSVDSLLRYFGLQDFFYPIRTAQNSAPKPSPQGLLEISSEWGIPVSQLLYIGDSKVDEQAAMAADMCFCAFNNSRLRAAFHVNNFFSLITILTEYIEVQN